MKKAFVLGVLISMGILSSAQPGIITRPSPTVVSLLNPNGDGWTTTSAGVFVTTEETESEISWTIAQQFEIEPRGDNGGGPCGSTDIVDLPAGSKAAMFATIDPNAIPASGDETFVFRLRTGTNPGTANFGFSVFIDADNRFGDDGGCSVDDPNAVAGNMGFEIEIRVVNGGGSKNVYLDDVDGTISGTNRASYSLPTNTQVVESLYGHDCTTPVFYDFAIPWTDLTTWFGINETSLVRLAFMTTSNGTTALGNTASDVGGIDDRNYATDDLAEKALVCSMNPTPLPVTLISFKATKENTSVILDWSTIMELNNDFFTIERSSNGIDFEDFVYVNGAGNSSALKNYSTIDIDPLKGTSYYRLKQTDFNDFYEYLGVVAVNFENDAEPKVYPNPTNGLINIDFGDYNGLVDYSLTTIEGRIVNQEQNVTTNKMTINLNNNGKGIYLLKIENATSSKVYKIIKE